MTQSDKSKTKGKGSTRMLPVLHPDAAGIDVGAEEVFVAVPPDRAAEPVRSKSDNSGTLGSNPKFWESRDWRVSLA